MRLGKVVGSVWSTACHPRMIGAKLMVVADCDTAGVPTDEYTVAIDEVGVGEGEMVLTVAGSSARMTPTGKRACGDTVITSRVDRCTSTSESPTREEVR